MKKNGISYATHGIFRRSSRSLHSAGSHYGMGHHNSIIGCDPTTAQAGWVDNPSHALESTTSCNCVFLPPLSFDETRTSSGRPLPCISVALLIDEFDFHVYNLAVDLRDGVRLTRLVEVVTGEWDLAGSLRVPAVSRLQVESY